MSKSSHEKTLDDLLDQVDSFISKAWQTVSDKTDVSEISEKVMDHIHTSFHASIASARDALYQHAPNTPFTPPPPPPPPAPSPKSPLDIITSRPLLSSLIATSVAGSSIYIYFYPPAWIANVPLLRLIVPKRRRPLPSTPRPKMAADGSGARLEAVLVLGAEKGSLGRQIALDLEKRGFLVIATVANKNDIQGIELESRGYINAIAFNPSDPSTIPSFLRNLSTALSLKYPKSTAGDPFRPAHLLACLCAVVNALPITPSVTGTSNSNGNIDPTILPSTSSITPLEAQDLEQIQASFSTKVISSIGVIQGCLPLLRQSRHAPGLVLTLVHSSTSRISLPFTSIQSATDSALVSAMESLRRELKLGENSRGKLRVVNFDVGFFEPLPSDQNGDNNKNDNNNDNQKQQDTKQQQQSFYNNNNKLNTASLAGLSPHINEIYGPAILRRSGSSSYSSFSPTTAEPSPSHHSLRRKSNINRLTNKVAKLILSSRKPTRRGVGAGSWTYYLASLLPSILIDRFLIVQDGMAWLIDCLYRSTNNNNKLGASPRPLPDPPVNNNNKGKQNEQEQQQQQQRDDSTTPKQSTFIDKNQQKSSTNNTSKTTRSGTYVHVKSKNNGTASEASLSDPEESNTLDDSTLLNSQHLGDEQK